MTQPLTDDDIELDLLLRQHGPDFNPIWADLQEAMDSERTVNAQVLDSIEGGLLAYVGLLGMIPASHIDNGRSRNRDQYIGKSLPVRVIDMDRLDRDIVCFVDRRSAPGNLLDPGFRKAFFTDQVCETQPVLQDLVHLEDDLLEWKKLNVVAGDALIDFADGPDRPEKVRDPAEKSP